MRRTYLVIRILYVVIGAVAALIYVIHQDAARSAPPAPSQTAR
jgi:hypothetical protein